MDSPLTETHQPLPLNRVARCAALYLLVALGAACSGPAANQPSASSPPPAEGATADGNSSASASPVSPAATEGASQVLRHAVFFKFKEASSDEQIQEVVDAFQALPDKIDAIIDFQWGVNNSPEKHDDGFTPAFLVTFDSEEGRAAYLPHPEHAAFVELLMPVLDKVRVLDF